MTARSSRRIRYVVQIDVNHAHTENIRYIYVILEVGLSVHNDSSFTRPSPGQYLDGTTDVTRTLVSKFSGGDEKGFISSLPHSILAPLLMRRNELSHVFCKVIFQSTLLFSQTARQVRLVHFPLA